MPSNLHSNETKLSLKTPNKLESKRNWGTLKFEQVALSDHKSKNFNRKVSNLLSFHKHKPAEPNKF